MIGPTEVAAGAVEARQLAAMIAGCLAIVLAVAIVLLVLLGKRNDYPDPHKEPWEDEP